MHLHTWPIHIIVGTPTESGQAKGDNQGIFSDHSFHYLCNSTGRKAVPQQVITPSRVSVALATSVPGFHRFYCDIINSDVMVSTGLLTMFKSSGPLTEMKLIPLSLAMACVWVGGRMDKWVERERERERERE